jgi:hypothetical protein
MYFNPNCFSQEAFGTLGNFGREGLYGPALVNVSVAGRLARRVEPAVGAPFGKGVCAGRTSEANRGRRPG